MLLGVKKYSEKLLLPLAKLIKGVPANIITLFGMLSAIVVFIGFTFRFPLMFTIFLFITELLDQLDGLVARLQGSTIFGSFLDSTLDRVGDFFILFGIILGGYIEVYLGLIVIAGSFLTSYTRAKIESLGIKDLYGIGLLERTDRVPIIFIGSILYIWFSCAIFWTMVFLAIGTSITTIQRIIFAYKNFTSNNTEE